MPLSISCEGGGSVSVGVGSHVRKVSRGFGAVGGSLYSSVESLHLLEHLVSQCTIDPVS